MDESALRTLIANLEACRSSNHWWFEFCTALVAIGVLFEVIFVIWEYVDELHDFGRGIVHPPERPNILLFALGLLGAGLVAIGVAGEFRFESKIESTETNIRKANDELFLLLSKEAGDAAKSAKTAHDEADTVGKRADALARTLTTDESDEVVLKDEILKLQAKLGDRHLTPDQQHIVAMSLGHKGEKLSFIVLSKEREVTNIAHDIFNAIAVAGNKESAQWDCSFFVAPTNADPTRGIRIEILSPQSGKGDRAAVSNLVVALSSYLDVNGPVPMREFRDDFPYSVDKFVAGNDRGEGTIDPNARIRIIIGKK